MEREAMPKKKVCRNQRSWAWPSVIPLCLERRKFKQENFNVGARGLLYSTFSSIYNSEWGYGLGGHLIYIKPQNYLRSFRKVKARSIRSQSLDLETRHAYFKTAPHVIVLKLDWKPTAYINNSVLSQIIRQSINCSSWLDTIFETQQSTSIK